VSSRSERLCCAHRDERGSITVFTVIVAVALLFLAALVIDGSRQLSARARAIAYAEEAARTGAQKINIDVGWVQLLDADARSAVDEYCAAATSADSTIQSCTTTGMVENTDKGSVASVTVEVTVEFDPIMLDLFMWNSDGQVLVTGEATAHPIEGITEPALADFTPPPPVVDTDPVKPGIPIGTTVAPTQIPLSPCPSETPEEPPDGGGGGGGPKPPATPTSPTPTVPCQSSTPPG